MSEIAKYDNGSTVFAGDNVIDKNKIDKYPIISNFGSLLTQIGDGELADAFFSIATGAVPTPSSELLYGNVSSDGVVDDFEGPGYVVVDNDKITVNPPGDFVWGYNSPYLQAKIVPDGIDIFNNKTNQTVGHIDPKTMTNDTIPGQRVNVETLKYWYNHYGQGSKYNLDYCINGFNDNRSYITPDMLKEKFPEAFAQFKDVCATLENHYRDMQDMEFTVEHGKLYMLQTRNGKRTAQAALKIACDLVDEGMRTEKEAVAMIDPRNLDTLLHPQFDQAALKAATPAEEAVVYKVVFR